MNFNNAEFELSFGDAGQLVKSTCPEVVFSGRSNVGKSSLINKLLGRKSLARVSAKPGKTGTINFYKLNGARLVDLPGYGYAKVSLEEKKRWARLVEGYWQDERNVVLAIQIVDMRHEPTANDIDMINYLNDRGTNLVVVLNKCDKLNKTNRELMLNKLKQMFDGSGIDFIVFSAVTGEGVENLRALISQNCKTSESTK